MTKKLLIYEKQIKIILLIIQVSFSLYGVALIINYPFGDIGVALIIILNLLCILGQSELNKYLKKEQKWKFMNFTKKTHLVIVCL